MPRRWILTVLAACLVALSAATVCAQEKVPIEEQALSASGHPLRNILRQPAAPPLASRPPRLPDYRRRLDPNSQRVPRPYPDTLPLFGYNIFEPARQLIEARRAHLVEAGLTPPKTGRISAPPKQQEPAELTPEERAAIAALTPAKELDLLRRQRDDRLTEEERRLYRSILSPKRPAPDEMEEEPEKPPQDENGDREEAAMQRTSQDRPSSPQRAEETGRPRSRRDMAHDRPDRDDERETDEEAQRRRFNAYFQAADPVVQLLKNVVATVPANYQLSGGDEITLRLWSPTMELVERVLLVDETGAISVPDVGRVSVLGKTLAQAEADLRQRLRRFYRDAEVSLALKELRTMPVIVSGESFAAGTYIVPAVATAFNLLYATGGPTEEGSLRRIEIRRNGALVATLDLYKFLITGDKTGDVPLRPGDVIFIPGRHSTVTLRGEVRRPAIYELIEGETLRDALNYAGGVKPSGVDQRVQVTTVQPGAARILKDVDISGVKDSKPVPVYDGDVVDVFSVRNTLVNKVTIEGAVDQPAEYALTPDMTVADLVQRARGLLSEAYPARADLFRYNPDNTLTLIPVNLEKALAGDPKENIALTRWDRLKVYTQAEVVWIGRREVTVRGAVQRQGIYYRSDNMRVKDLLLQAGGTLPEAYLERAFLLHQNPDGSFTYEYPNIALALKDDPQHNVLLQDHDILAVYRTDEARFTPERSFNIQGEVWMPGIYPRGEGMRLSDALKIAGGLRPRAGDEIFIAHARREQGTEPTRAIFSSATSMPSPDPLLEDGDLITVPGRGNYQERPYVVHVSGAVHRPGPVILRGPNVRLSDVIKEAGGLKPEAFPEGIEFQRNPSELATNEQRQTAGIISQINDLLNQSEYARELARSDIEKRKALGEAASSALPINIPGLTPSPPQTPQAPADAQTQAASASALMERDLVSKPRVLSAADLAPRGNVAVNLAAALRNPGSSDDPLMVDGDRVTVPEKPTTVQVVGAVYTPRGVLHREGARVDYYIEQTGGYTADAAKDRVQVVRFGGGLVPLKKAGKLQPGDVIVVPTKVLAERLSGRTREIDQIFRNLTSSALVVLVAKSLFGL